MRRRRPSAKRRRALVDTFLDLVDKVARRMAKRLPSHVELEELKSAGNVGPMEAADRYDHKRRAKFPSYAEFRIKGSMIDELRKRDTLSRDMRILSNHLRDATRVLTHQHGREPLPDEMAEHLGVSIDRLYEQQQKLSGEHVVGLDDVSPDLLDIHADPGAVDPFERLARAELCAHLASAIETLPIRYQQVLAMYYIEDLTLAQIGRALGITESRVCQIHGEATRRLREEVDRDAH